jgi:hypothetical protein
VQVTVRISPSPLYSIVFCFAGSLFAVPSPLRCIDGDTLFLIFAVNMDEYSVVFIVAWFDYLLSSFAIVFFFDTLYVCSGDGHSAKQKAHAFLPCESI